MSWFVDPAKRMWRCPPVLTEAIAFHSRLPGYARTPLKELPELASELGVGRVFVKDESSRLGLPAFKILGVSWAVNCALTKLARLTPHDSIEDLQSVATAMGSPKLVTATDGNHGRALARIASLLGLSAHIVVPRGLPRAVIVAIESEGASCQEVAGSYDDAVAAASKFAETTGSLLTQDTAWDGYEEIPGWIVEGYSTLVIEADAQLADLGLATSLVAVPTGVGSLLQAVVTHYRSGEISPSILCVEPETAACVMASLDADTRQTVATPGTVMAGLNCGTTSSISWPILRNGLDAAVTVSDSEAMRSVRELDALGVSSGPCGAASLAGVRKAISTAERRDALDIDSKSVILLISTEGLASGSAS